MSAKRPAPKGLQVNKEKSVTSGDYGVDAQYDRLMIVSKASDAEDAIEESAVYALTDAGFEALTGTEFEPAAGSTIEAGTLGNGMRVVQILKSEVRSYDGGKFALFLESYPSQFMWSDGWAYRLGQVLGKFSIFRLYVFAARGAIWKYIISYSNNESELSTLQLCLMQSAPCDMPLRAIT